MMTKAELLTELQQYGSHPDEIIVDMVNNVNLMFESYKRGGLLKKSEVEELINDVLDTHRVYRLTQDSIRQTQIVQTVTLIKNIVSLLLPLI